MRLWGVSQRFAVKSQGSSKPFFSCSRQCKQPLQHSEHTECQQWDGRRQWGKLSAIYTHWSLNTWICFYIGEKKKKVLGIAVYFHKYQNVAASLGKLIKAKFCWSAACSAIPSLLLLSWCLWTTLHAIGSNHFDVLLPKSDWKSIQV